MRNVNSMAVALAFVDIDFLTRISDLFIQIETVRPLSLFLSILSLCFVLGISGSMHVSDRF
jgi:hypothetical protein